MDRFSGKVAVVTGSSAEIGAAISKKLIKNGVKVVGLARRKDKLKNIQSEIELAGYRNKFFRVQCDIRNDGDLISAFQYIIENVGNISILINNAGVCQPQSLPCIPKEEIDSTFDTNVKGLLLCAQHAIKNMRENSIKGHIINVCSMAGQPGWIPDLPIALYSASKHAVKVITDSLRREMALEKTEIKVSNLCPGIVKTDMTVREDLTDPLEYLSVEDIANACINILSTPPNMVISELVILPINQQE